MKDGGTRISVPECRPGPNGCQCAGMNWNLSSRCHRTWTWPERLRSPAEAWQTCTCPRRLGLSPVSTLDDPRDPTVGHEPDDSDPHVDRNGDPRFEEGNNDSHHVGNCGEPALPIAANRYRQSRTRRVQC